MHLVNRSSLHLPFQFLPLIDTVREKAQFAELATVVVDDRWDGKVTGGYSIKRPDRDDLQELKLAGLRLPKKAAPSLIKLDVSHGGRYPRTSLHIEEVGPVIFNTWEEEVLFVLAHEQAHVDQFWTKPLPEHEAEVEAERFAVQVLKHYRATRTASQCESDGSLHKPNRTSQSRPQ